MAENPEVKKNKIADSFSVSTDSGISHIAAKFQDGVDYWVDLVFDQFDKDIGYIKRGIRKAGRKFANWVSVSTPGGLSAFAAKTVRIIDSAVNTIGDNIEFQAELIKNGLTFLKEQVWEHRILVIKYFAALVLIYIAITGAINYSTGYEYSYNGRTLGIVKQQEDVLSVVEVASDGMTLEYGIDVQLDTKEDFKFTKVVILGKTTDTSDDVLSKLIYMQDTKVSAYAITVDGTKVATVESYETAENVLQRIKNAYIDEDDSAKYTSITFWQNVEINEVNTTVGKLMTENTAYRLLKTGESRIKHKVTLGETPDSISEAFSMSKDKFFELNPKLDKGQGTLRTGEIVTVINKSPKLKVVAEKVSKYKKSYAYKVKKVETKSLYKGDTKTKIKGKKGKKLVTARIRYENGKEVSRVILNEKVLTKPVTKVVLVGTKKRPPTIGSGELTDPCPAGYLSSTFGQRWGRLHRGVDLACAAGNDIYAADGGTVIVASYNGSYGNYIKINHQNGMVTTYAHASRLCVSVGQKVYKGQLIAKVGNTGNSYGAHCHFEVEVNGSLTNPLNYIR